MRIALCLLALVMGLPGTAAAQLNVNLPGFNVSIIAGALPLMATSMAVDRFGNVYVVDGVTFNIARVTPGGSVSLQHVTGLSGVGQLAYNPVDGLVYLTAINPLAATITDVLRLDATGGTTVEAGFRSVARARP